MAGVIYLCVACRERARDPDTGVAPDAAGYFLLPHAASHLEGPGPHAIVPVDSLDDSIIAEIKDGD